MQELNLILIFTDKLNKLGINYILTGSMASIIYGDPRLTNDIDIVIELIIKDIDKLYNAFPLKEFYCPPPEIIKIEALRSDRAHFNLIHHVTGFKADIYLAGQNPFQKWALDNYREFKLENQIIRLAPPEYVIIKKLEYFREGGSQKHISDIKSIIQNTGTKINQNLLNSYITQFSLEKQWNELIKK